VSDEDLAVEQEQETDESQEELSEDEKAMAELKEAIVVKREEVGSLRLKLTVTVPQETVDGRLGKEFVELKREALVPGFRKGHAPLKLVEKRFASDVGDRLKSQLIGGGYLAAVDKEKIKPLGDPLVWVKTKEQRTGEDQKPRTVEVEKLLPLDRALEHLTLPKDGPLTFSCELEVKPEFELPKLEKIPVERPAVSIDDDDVDGQIDRMRMVRGTYQPVEKGKIKADDLLYVGLKMSVGGDVVATEENFDLPARDSRVKGVLLVGLGEKLVGRKTGDSVTFEATLPDDHENLDLRGKTAQFEFTIREVKRLELPPLDDEFLATVGFESETELRRTVRSSLESRLDQTIKSKLREQVGRYLVDQTNFEIPSGLSQRQTDRSLARRMIEMYQQGVPQTQIERAMDELRVKAHEQVVRDLKLYFILEKIAEERKIDVNEERINAAIADIAQRTHKRFDRVRDELSKGDGIRSLYLQLRDQDVLDALLADAEVTETQGPKKAVGKTAKKRSAPKKTTKKGTTS